MKKLIYLLPVLALLLLIIHSCKIDPATGTVIPASSGQLGATKLTIGRYNLDTVSVIGAPSGATVVWSVSPSNYGYLTPVGSNALIHFEFPGTFTVTAVVNGGTPLTIAITVTPSTGTIPPAGAVTHYSLTGDQVVLTPRLHTGSLVDSTYIWFNGLTSNSYPCGTSDITYTKALSSANAFSLNFVDVTQPSVCGSSSGPAQLRTPPVFSQNAANQYLSGTGTYPLTITLSGVTYTGSITVNPTTITFNWTYVTGVIITPKTITR